MPLNLISTKLTPPQPPAGVVERSQLHARLQQGLDSRLILLAAPAGSGKTTLLASWLRQLNRSAAWVSLDALDNELERFLLYLVSAVQQLEPTLAAGLPDLLQTQTLSDATHLMARLINDLAAWGGELLLVLDDYHLIDNPKVHQAVQFLLDKSPAGMCLVIASRTDPPLLLSRLRVRGQLLEIRADGLRFEVEETRAFLDRQQGLRLSSQDLMGLQERTEGWVAALQLAALSLSGERDKAAFISDLVGSHEHLSDYLMNQVLAQQTPQVQQFLMRTSILERFTAALCQVVSGQPDSHQLLKQLLDSNLFLVALDDGRKWFRYHHLFSEFLRHRLSESEVTHIPELYLRASEWFEQQGWKGEATEYAFLAGDLVRAAQAVQRLAPDLVTTGRSPQLLTYIERLSEPVLGQFPFLLVYACIALHDTSQFEHLWEILEGLEPHQANPLIEASQMVFRGAQQLQQLGISAAQALFQQAVDLLSNYPPTNDTRDGALIFSMATNRLLNSLFRSDNLPQADRLLPLALEQCQRAGNHLGVVGSFARWGQIKHMQGQLNRAHARYSQGLQSLAQSKQEGKVVATQEELHLNFAELLYEWNRLGEMHTHLELAHSFNELSQYPPALAQEHKLWGQLHIARGAHAAAQEAVLELDRLAEGVASGNRLDQLSFEVAAMSLRLRLASIQPELEHLSEVRDWVSQNELEAEKAFDALRQSALHQSSYWIWAWLLVLEGEATRALEVLEPLLAYAKEVERSDDQIRYLILQALAYQLVQEDNWAVESLGTAIHLAEGEPYCRSFVDMGSSIYRLLKQLTGQHSAQVGKLLEAFSPDPLPTDQPRAPMAQPMFKPLPRVNGLDEPLSDGEWRVLQLLAVGHSNKDIATALNLSANTVRWYVGTLLSKLGAHNRLEAINRARELGLL